MPEYIYKQCDTYLPDEFYFLPYYGTKIQEQFAILTWIKNLKFQLGVVVHAFSFSNWEAVTLSLRSTWSIE